MAKKKPAAKKKAVAKKKTPSKKKAAKKKAPSGKTTAKKKAPAIKGVPFARGEAVTTSLLIIEACGDGRRCKQKPNGNFIRQNFISGRWQQVGGTEFPTLQSCKDACGG